MSVKFDLRQARYERACWWLEQGVHIVPLKPRSKELQPGYGARSAHITNQVFARKWFLNTEANLGIVLGQPIIVADWDSRDAYETWCKAAGAAVSTLTERTSQGFHMFFRGTSLISAVGNGCEFKTSGVCMVSPSIHPSGLVYQVVNDASIATIDAERAGQLFPFLSEKQHEQEYLGKGKGVTSSKGSVIVRLKSARPIVDEMIAAGIKLRPGGKTTFVGLCPFHSDHLPSLWVNSETGLWGCNKPGCVAAGTHDVINFRALRQGISNAMAIKQLADEFLPPLKIGQAKVEGQH